MNLAFWKPKKTQDEIEVEATAEEASATSKGAPIAYKAIVSYQEGLNVKEANDLAKQQVASLLKHPEICWYDVLPFENDETSGVLIEIQMLGPGKSHLAAIRDGLKDRTRTQTWFRTGNGRVNAVTLFQGKPQATLLSEKNSEDMLAADPEELAAAGSVEVFPRGSMKRAVKKGREPVWIGGIFFATSVVALGIATTYDHRRGQDLLDLRKFDGRLTPHAQWNLVSRPPDGQHVSKLQFEGTVWRRELTGKPIRPSMPTQAPQASPPPMPTPLPQLPGMTPLPGPATPPPAPAPTVVRPIPMAPPPPQAGPAPIPMAPSTPGALNMAPQPIPMQPVGAKP